MVSFLQILIFLFIYYNYNKNKLYSKGGIKAVVWTDAVQSGIMFGTYILIMIKGTIDLGGLGVVIDRNMESGRLELPEWVYPHYMYYMICKHVSDLSEYANTKRQGSNYQIWNVY